MAVHRSAAQGFAQGASAYARGRPGYPPEIVDWLRRAVGLGEGTTAIDLGAGTGKFTARMAETGAAVVAIEPVAAMRDEFARATPGIAVLAGSAESMPVADASVDAVLCAQTFHWFANPQALTEIRRVLKPGGRLGLVWNVRDESVGWVAELTGIMAPYQRDTPRQHDGAWRQLFPAEGFSPLDEQWFAHHATGSPDAVILDRILSVSFIAALPAAEQAVVAERLRDLIASRPELAGRDAVMFPYKAIALTCRKLS